jgi:hypothetical protein
VWQALRAARDPASSTVRNTAGTLITTIVTKLIKEARLGLGT